MATGVFESELLYSQSVSLQYVESQTGHREVGRYSTAQNSIVYIKDRLPFALNSTKHHDSNLVPRSLVDEAEGEIWQSKKNCFS